MRIASFLAGTWLCIALCVACCSVARAEPASPAAQTDYDHFINDALQAFDAGRWAEARTLFRRAHELEPTARTLRTIGMCSFNLGDYADALRAFDAALGETRKPLTTEQRTQLLELSERSSQRLGRFRLQLSPDNARLVVDGAEPAVLANKELLLEPGKHTIAISAGGYGTEHRELAVEGGDRATLQVRLQPTAASPKPVAEPEPVALPAPAQVPAATEARAEPQVAVSAKTPAPAPSGGARKTIAYVGLALGTAAVATFAITAGVAMAKQSKLDELCPAHRCEPANYGALDTYDRLKTISTISLLTGGALLSLSTVLLLTGGEPASVEHAAVEPMLGLGFAGVRGQL